MALLLPTSPCPCTQFPSEAIAGGHPGAGTPQAGVPPARPWKGAQTQVWLVLICVGWSQPILT